MEAHIVLAHPEPKSFNAHLARVAERVLRERAWQVSTSDLYAMAFDPSEKAEHYEDRRDPDRFDAQAEQRHASETQAIPPAVRDEIDRLDQADLLILQYPMWWHLPPAILKGWFDRVLVYGEVYRSDYRFEKGRFAGKKAMLSLTCGTSAATYAHNGRSADIDLLLWPVHFSLAYVGFDVIAPQVAYGVEGGGPQYSARAEITGRLKKIAADYASRLRSIETEPALPFNKMSEWGPDGRITPDAPVYTPFIRHREHLEID